MALVHANPAMPATGGAYHRPTSMDEALELLRDADSPLVPLAGGTDFYPSRVGRALDDDVLDLTAMAALRGIEARDDSFRIGATTTWTDLVRAKLPPEFDALKAAAREVGGIQIQNVGTLGGNLCNASPAADGTPNLLALDAQVELASATGVRTLPVADFVRGNRATARRPDELVTAIVIPRPRIGDGGCASSAFFKLGARRYLVISIVMVSAVLVVDASSRVTHARIAVGACSAVPRRLEPLEARLVGQPAEALTLAALASKEDVAVLSPIDDVRATAAYREDAALTGVRRAVAMAAQSVRKTS